MSPNLSPLGNFGGLTQTLVPMPGSPALHAGSAALLLAGITTDQRGLPRLVKGKLDIGAVELGPPSFKVTPPAVQGAIAGTPASVQLGSFADSDGKGPFTAVVDWGDGSGDSLTTVSAAGSLGSLKHTFLTAGSLTANITVADASGNISSTSFFVHALFGPTNTIAVNTAANQTDLAGSATVSLMDAVTESA